MPAIVAHRRRRGTRPAPDGSVPGFARAESHDPVAIVNAFWAHVHGNVILTLSGMIDADSGEERFLAGGYALLRGFA